MTGENETAATETTETSPNPTGRPVSRRTFLGGIATAGASPAMQDDGNQTGDNQTEGGQAVETRFELGGIIEGWQGRAPSSIEGQTNPTLNLQPGTRYRVAWQNADGAPHNFTIQDADGNDIIATRTTSQQGETLSLTFTASEEMAQYICTIHPNTMKGEMQVGGDGVGETRTTGPVGMVGGLAAVTLGSVVVLAYALSRYFEEPHEP